MYSRAWGLELLPYSYATRLVNSVAIVYFVAYLPPVVDYLPPVVDIAY